MTNSTYKVWYDFYHKISGMSTWMVVIPRPQLIKMMMPLIYGRRDVLTWSCETPHRRTLTSMIPVMMTLALLLRLRIFWEMKHLLAHGSVLVMLPKLKSTLQSRDINPIPSMLIKLSCNPENGSCHGVSQPINKPMQ